MFGELFPTVMTIPNLLWNRYTDRVRYRSPGNIGKERTDRHVQAKHYNDASI